MRQSKYGGDKDGIGLYELMVVPRNVYQKAIDAIRENRLSDFYDLLGVEPTGKFIHRDQHGTILIIEDKLEIAKAVEKALKTRGYDVSYSSDGAGLERVGKTEIAMIIIDITFPDVDVLHICHVLKESKITAHIPIIIINGNADEQDIIEGLNAGADDYIGKNFSVSELAARVKAVLRTYE